MEEYRLPVFERHVFVCQNSRPADAPRPSCTTDGKSELFTELQQRTKAAGLGGRVRINKAGCLDQCEHGPTVVVYPEAVWYGRLQASDAAEIVEQHLVGGSPWSGYGWQRSASTPRAARIAAKKRIHSSSQQRQQTGPLSHSCSPRVGGQEWEWGRRI